MQIVTVTKVPANVTALEIESEFTEPHTYLKSRCGSWLTGKNEVVTRRGAKSRRSKSMGTSRRMSAESSSAKASTTKRIEASDFWVSGSSGLPNGKLRSAAS